MTNDPPAQPPAIGRKSPRVHLNWFTRLFFTPIWKETSREFLRHDEHMWNGGGVNIDHYAVYAVYEECVVSGQKRVREEWKLRW